jgi:WG containing repeat
MSKYLSIIVFIFFFSHDCFGQGSDWFGVEKIKADTLYYPFYKGVQMIEVDLMGQREKVGELIDAQAGPWNIPRSEMYPKPLGNEYYFRDTSGKIVKVYNAAYSLKQAQNHFNSMRPNEIIGSRVKFRFSHHKSYDLSSHYISSDFRGYYKVFEPRIRESIQQESLLVKEGIRFGLIDSLGNLKIPIVYNEILPLGNKLLVCKDRKWGVVTKNNEVVVPVRFDYIENYYDIIKIISIKTCGDEICIAGVKSNNEIVECKLK